MIRLLLTVPGALVGVALSLPALILALPFWLVRWAVCRFDKFRTPETTPKNELIQYDSVLGWKPKPGVRAHLLIEGDGVYAVGTDEEGWPLGGANRLDDAELVVIGDSFAFGYGANPGERFIDFLQDVPTKAFGAPGFDMVQELRVLQELGPKLRGKLVVWLVYVENDIAESVRPHWLGYRKPFVKKPAGAEAWSLVHSHLSPEPWRASGEGRGLADFAELCTPGPYSERLYSACEHLVREGAASCRAAGAQGLVVVSVPNMNQLEREGAETLRGLSPDPSAFDVQYPHRRLEGICTAAGVRHVSGLEHFEATHYKRFERFHWNPLGHRQAAQLLRSIYRERDRASAS